MSIEAVEPAVPKARLTHEELVARLRQADDLVSQGHSMADAIQSVGATELYSWRRDNSDQASQARRIKELETENARLRSAVADLTLDKIILQEAAVANF